MTQHPTPHNRAEREPTGPNLDYHIQVPSQPSEGATHDSSMTPMGAPFGEDFRTPTLPDTASNADMVPPAQLSNTGLGVDTVSNYLSM